MPKALALPPPPVTSVGPVTLEDIIQRLEAEGRTFDRQLLADIHAYSAELHRDQVRRSGAPYFTHPLSVAYLLADLRFDATCVAVGLLHDVLEDTLATPRDLAKRFGAEVGELVDGVTKIGRHTYVRRDHAQAETFRKMILASAKDIRVIVVKLADRLHNMMTLEHLPPDKRKRIARETLEIYAPIAHRLGMARVQGDLEDLGFYYLHPQKFTALHQALQRKMKGGKGGVEAIRRKLAKAIKAGGADAELSFRVKRYYSIYRKLNRQGIDISELYDYLAFRVVTANLRDTYAVLGIVHQTWRPIPGRFKDYIAMPKPNLYQSLHTTVVGESGQPFEVQIRTREMDLVAEEGIAAHWRYKEGEGKGDQEGDANILWLRQLLEWQKEIKDPTTFLTTLKVDLYPDEVYLFTPKGKVMSFPRGATPLDFAYRVHTELGHHCVGARVNGRLVPLRTQLQNGDLVEILTNPSRTPSRDWLNIAVTPRARSKIRHWLNTQQKQRATEIGRRLFEREVRKLKVSPRKVVDRPRMAEYLAEEGLGKMEELYSRIGFGKAHPRQILERVLAEEELSAKAEPPGRFREAVRRILPLGRGQQPIEVKGHGDLLAYLAKCCKPLPGEEIVGYITRGRGVSVHSVSCANVQNLLYNPERKIDVAWAKRTEERFRIGLDVETEDRPGILAKLADAVSRQDTNIAQLEAETYETGRGLIRMVVELRDLDHLESLKRLVQGIPGVIRVRRQREGNRDVASTGD